MTAKLYEASKIFLIIVLSFLFGWNACGYKIYAKDFHQTAGLANVRELGK